MSNIKYINEQINRGENVYLYEDLREIVVKITPKYNCYAKYKGKTAYLIDHTTKTVADVELGGKTISKEEFETF